MSTVNCQLPTVKCQLLTVNCQLSTANCQLSSANCQLPSASFWRRRTGTLGYRLSTRRSSLCDRLPSLTPSVIAATLVSVSALLAHHSERHVYSLLLRKYFSNIKNSSQNLEFQIIVFILTNTIINKIWRTLSRQAISLACHRATCRTQLSGACLPLCCCGCRRISWRLLLVQWCPWCVWGVWVSTSPECLRQRHVINKFFFLFFFFLKAKAHTVKRNWVLTGWTLEGSSE